MTLRRSLLPPTFLLSCLLVPTSVALAKPGDPVEAPPPPVIVEPAYAEPLMAPPAPVAAPQPAPVPARAPHRFRFALEGGAGVVVGEGDSEGGGVSLALQLGYQASDLFAIYYQGAITLDGWAREDDGSFDAYAFSSNMAMFDFTLGRFFQVGGGVGADVGSFGVCNENMCDLREGETQLATEARVAVVIPLPGIRARWGIPISLRVHSTHFENSQLHTITLNTGIMRF